MKNYRSRVEDFFDQTLDMLFPERYGCPIHTAPKKESLSRCLDELLCFDFIDLSTQKESIIDRFTNELDPIKIKLNKDIEAIYSGDPAATSRLEVIMAYPGFFALAAYRVAHVLYQVSVPLIPRIITEYANSLTSIDIHPGAKIGIYVCIDHGSGVVIGETTKIGDHVKIYQGVTLGALSIPKNKSKEKRHPTIEDHVTIYAQATILGDTTIGRNSIIGGNVWITKDVPPDSKIIYESSNQNIINPTTIH